jgi:phospholipase/carboxylesterase
MNRRQLLQLLGAGAFATACSNVSEVAADRGRLVSHVHSGHGGGSGVIPLHMAQPRDGFLYVPRAGTLPLVVMLHGAGGGAQRIVDRYRDLADELGFIMLVPESREPTWDVVRSDFGPDVQFIDRALDRVFGQYSIDASHLAVAGFSDGASYALSLGITNGDLFTHVLAFSPGFAVPAARRGTPRIFISHGTEDEILPIDSTSRKMVPVLRDAGYKVEYVEFDGPHTVPREIAHQGFAWFVK